MRSNIGVPIIFIVFDLYKNLLVVLRASYRHSVATHKLSPLELLGTQPYRDTVFG